MPNKGGVDAMLIWTIGAVILLALLGSGAFASNNQVRRRNRAQEAWSGESGAEGALRHGPIPRVVAALNGIRLPEHPLFKAGAGGAAHGRSALRQRR
jgi:hypothetical protein